MDFNTFFIIILFLLVICVGAGLIYVNYRNREQSEFEYDEENEELEEKYPARQSKPLLRPKPLRQQLEADDENETENDEDESEDTEEDNTQNDDIMSKKNKSNHYGGGGYSDDTDRSDNRGGDRYRDSYGGGNNRNRDDRESDIRRDRDDRDDSRSSYNQRTYNSNYSSSSYNRSRRDYDDYDDLGDGYGQRRASRSSNANTVDESKPSTVAIIYRSEMDYISRCIHDYPNIETGGQLFGFLTENGSPVVCYAIGPGRNANHQAAFFNQDTRYLQDVFDEVNARFGLRYIGEWHSHHQLGLAKPSGHDARTIIRGMQRSNFRHFLLCIGNCDDSYHSTLNAFTFHLDNPYNYIQAPWKIIERESPYRPLIDHELRDMLEHPSYRRASHGALYTVDQSGRQAVVIPDYSAEYWLNNKANNLVLKEMLDFLKAEEPNSMVKPMLDNKKHVHLYVERPGRKEHIVFTEYFPETPPVILNQSDEILKDPEGWNYSGDILKAFTRYYRGALRAERQRMEQRKKEAMQVVSDRIKPTVEARNNEGKTNNDPLSDQDIDKLKDKFKVISDTKSNKSNPSEVRTAESKTSNISNSTESITASKTEQSQTSPSKDTCSAEGEPQEAAAATTKATTTLAEEDPKTETLRSKDPELAKAVVAICEDEANKNITSSMAQVDEVASSELDFGERVLDETHPTSKETSSANSEMETNPSPKEAVKESYGESEQVVGMDEVRKDKDTSVTEDEDRIPEYDQSVSYIERSSDEVEDQKDK